MDCWTVLQLPQESDERSIKRTYARLLKNCRPDDDAEGFQRLREAYEEALAYARWRADWEEEAETAPAAVAESAYGNLNDLAELMNVNARPPCPACNTPARPGPGADQRPHPAQPGRTLGPGPTTGLHRGVPGRPVAPLLRKPRRARRDYPLGSAAS